MAAPTPYSRLYRLVDNPAYDPTEHDAEFDDIETTLDGILANLPYIQRGDNLLANSCVHPDSLTTATKALIAADWTPRGAWLTATLYMIGDVVEETSVSYVCALAHVSGTFATDHTAGKWVVLGGTPTSSAAGITFSPTGTIAATDVQAAIAEVSGDVSALAGYGLKFISGALAQKHVVAPIAADLNVAASDRAKAYVFTSGSWTATLPAASGMTDDFFVILKNAGSGIITIAKTGTDTIDGATSIALLAGDSLTAHSDGSGAWYTTGQGRSLVNLAFGDGTEAAPSVRFTTDTDTGLYRPSANVLAAVAGGLDVMRWKTAAGAVNAIDVFPAATGAFPYLQAYGDDANVGLRLKVKGTERVYVDAPLSVTSSGAVGTYGVNVLTNGGGGSMLVQNNSAGADAYGINVLTSSVGVPALLSTSVGYYAGLFKNISDLGSSGANANAIGIVAQSRQGYPAYFEQGGSSQTLTRDNVYSALYVTRTITGANPAPFDFTGPVLYVDDTTSSTGDLLRLDKVGVKKVAINSAGKMTTDLLFQRGTTTAIGTFDTQALVITTDNNTRITISSGGAVKIASLAGTGSRTVVAAADGTLSAP